MKPFVSGCCEDERCSFEGCSGPAEHKVEETIFHDDPIQHRHELTAYICHQHFRAIMGPAADRRTEIRAHKVMTAEEYAETPLKGWHEVCRDVDGFGGIGIRYLGTDDPVSTTQLKGE